MKVIFGKESKVVFHELIILLIEIDHCCSVMINKDS